MKIVRTLGLGLAASFLFAACTQPPPAPEPAADTTAADTAAVRAHIEQFLVAWNAGDRSAIAPMIAEDVVLLQPVGPVIEGREAILDMIAGAYDTSMLQQSATIDEILIFGDQAYGRGTWKLDPTEGAGAEAQAANGKWSTLYQRRVDGSWQLWRWIWNQDTTPAAPAES